jgi:predicted Zn-dependent protease
MQQAPQQQAWQQPQQQVPYPPNGAMPPHTVAMGAPPTIPQGPVTMGSFNRQPTQQPVQQRPPQQPPRQTPRQPQQQDQPESQQPVVIPGLENLPQYDRKAGDYSQQVIRLGGSFARWTSFPIRVHIPMNTQDNWRAAIDGAVKKWSQFIPVMIAPPNEPADIEIGWINHLMPRQLGITNLEIFNGHPRVTIYLLRPSYYPPDITEASLQRVALHQIGHGLGLFGHSNNPADAMFALDTPVKSGLPKTPSVTMRDVNTLRKIYEAQPLPDGFQSPQPISWP